MNHNLIEQMGHETDPQYSNPLYSESDTIFHNGQDFGRISRLNDCAQKKLINYIKNRPHEIYGSYAASVWGSKNQRNPNDLDIAAVNVKKTATGIFDILKSCGYVPKLIFNPEWGSAAVQLYDQEKKEWDTIVDVQPLSEHQKTEYENIKSRSASPGEYGGLSTQSPNDQLRRKANSIYGDTPEHRVEKDSYDYISTLSDLAESNQLKGHAEIMRGEIPERSRFSHLDVAIEAMRVSKNKGVPFSDLAPALRDQTTNPMERNFLKFAVMNPKANLDDIDVDQYGNVYYKDRRVSKGCNKKSKSFSHDDRDRRKEDLWKEVGF